jgi:lysophospholipase L1-like esterase
MQIIYISILCLIAVSVSGAPSKSDRFHRDGERVAVIGDSITAWGRYASIVHLFHQLRMPDRNITWFNNGLAGDQAMYTKWRAKTEGNPLDRDILRNRPTTAMIMLGMNDARNASVWERPEADKQERIARAANDYRTAMDELLPRLQTNGVERFLFIISTPYDETTRAKRKALIGKNDFIRNITGKYLREQARTMMAQLIDLNTPMMAINRREQVNNPTFSLADLGDRVHPVKMGQFTMAYFILREMGFDQTVSIAELNAANSSIVSAKNCSLSNLKKTADSVRFDYLAESLPFPTSEYDFNRIVPFDADLNQEILQVGGLSEGRHTLKIDGQSVGSWTAKEFADGINVATNPKTPQYQQAVRVSKVSARSWLAGNSKRHLIGNLRLLRLRRLTTKEAQLKYMRSRRAPASGVARERHEEFIRLLAEGRIEAVIDEAIRKSVSLNEQAYLAAKPVSHEFELVLER